MWYIAMQREKRTNPEELLAACLTAFVRAGTIDLSLDQLAKSVGMSKRMLIHYFGGREEIEEGAMALLEEHLRQQLAPGAFAPTASPESVISALWDRTTAPGSRGVLLLVMDLSRRAWNGSSRAKAFYAEQQRLWIQVLMEFLPNRLFVEELLQLFQGAVLAFLITGDPAPGKISLLRFLSNR
jgi:AcrR family transcriptional regulator